MKRIYFLVPDLETTQQIIDTLLLERIEERRLHVLAKRGRDLGELPEASFLQRSDVLPALWQGMVAGGGLGLIAGIAAMVLPLGLAAGGGTVLVMMWLGVMLGGFASSLIGVSTPNRYLAEYADAIERGQLLVMVDVPRDRVGDVTRLLGERYPSAVCKGTDPSIPAFP